MNMSTIRRTAIAACTAAIALTAQPAIAQSLDDSTIITLYKIKGDRYMDALRFMAMREKVAAEAGLPADVFYFHEQGAGWTMIQISQPWPDDAMEKMEAAGKKLNIPKPAPGAFMAMINDHEDVIVSGPTTATAKLAEWEKAGAE